MRHLFLLLTMAALLSCHKDSAPVKPLLLKSVTTMNEEASGDYFTYSKDSYTYSSDGRLSTKQQFTYDNQNSVYVLNNTFNFTFTEDKLSIIEETVAATNQKTTIQYLYTNSKVSKILLNDAESTIATIQYLSGDTVSVLYQQSDGQFFTYKFVQKNNDISYEQTRDENNQLTSEITHEYETTINPYSLLGYTDLFFSNQSLHNMASTTSTYIGSYPVLVPVSYEYLYNDRNLPTQQIITYKTYPNLDKTAHSKILFEYQQQ